MTTQAEDRGSAVRFWFRNWWIAIGLAWLVIHLVVDAVVGASMSSGWLSASYFAQCVIFLLFGVALAGRLVAHRRAQELLETVNRDLRGAQASLKTANNALRSVQDALRQSDQRFRDSANSAPMMFWTSDATEEVTFANKALCEFRGLTEEESRRKPWEADIHPDDLPRCRAVFKQALDRREAWRLEYRYRRHDGAYRWLLEMGTPQYDIDGTFLGVVGTCVDITDQQEIQDALRVSQEDAKRARQLLIDGIEGLVDGLAIYDAEDRLVICNQRYRGLFGLSPDLLTPGTPFVDILRAHVGAGRVPAAVGREEKWVAERMMQHRDPHGVFERCIDGEWYQFSDRPTSTGGTVTIFTRIDELKQRETRLRESQAMLEAVINSIPLTVSITDRGRRIVLLNKAIEDLYGVRLADVVGRPVDEFRPRRYQTDTAIADHFRVVETGEPIFGHEDQYASVKGAESWITNLVPIKDDQGVVKCVLRTTLEVPQLAKANRELAAGRAVLIEAEREAKITSWYQPLGSDHDATWSENSIDVLGVPPERLSTDAQFLAIVHSDDRERLARLFQEINRHPAPYDVECRVMRPDGKVAWIHGISRIQRDESGAPLRMIGTVQDITEQKRIEETLRQQQALLLAAQRRARIGVWLLNVGSSDTAFDPDVMTEILGIPAADIPRNDPDFLRLVHPSDRARVEATYRRRVENNEPYAVEYRLIAPDGSVRWLRELAEFKPESNAAPARFIGTIQDITEQKSIEEALRESETRMRGFMDHVPVGLMVKDLDRRVLLVNRKAASYLSADPESLLGHRTAEFLDGGSAANIRAHEEEVIASGKAVAKEIHFPNRLQIEWSYEVKFPIRNETGDLVGLGAVFMDVSDRKRADAALRDSEARLRGFLDHAPFAMYLRDTNQTYLLVNRVVEESLNLPAESICGKTVGEIHPPTIAEQFIAADEKVLQTGTPLTYEHSDPSRKTFAEALTVRFPIRDDEGRIIAIGGITQDISERKRAEAALQASEARLRAFMDNAPVGMLVKDNKGIVRSINRLGASFLGRRPDEIVGRHSSEYSISGSASVVAANEAAVMRKGIVVERELQFPERPDLEWVHEVKFPIRDAYGDTLGLGAIVMNITDRKRAEAARLESEALLRGFMENSPVAMSIKAPDGRYLLVNRWVKLVLGRSTDEIVGKSIGDISASAGFREVRDMEMEVLRTGSKVEREVRFEDRATFNWTHEVKFPILDSEGNTIAIGGVAIDIADRKLAELALRDSQARLIEAQRRAKLAYWYWSHDSDTHEWSPEAANVLGRPGESLPFRDNQYLRLVHSDDRAAVEQLYNSYLRRPESYGIDYRILRSDGTTGWIRELGEPEFDASGHLTRCIGTIQDVTDQKKSEEALRESESLLLAAQRRAKIAYWTADLEANDTYVASDQAAEVLGITHAEMPVNDTSYLQLVHPADRARVANAFQRQIALQIPYAIDYRVVRPGGAIGWIRDLAEIERDAAGRPLRIIGTIQDITEEKRATEAMRNSEERLRAFFDHAPFTMYLKDTEHRYVMANRELERVEGRSATAILGKTARDTYPPVLAQRFEAEDRQVLETGRSVVSDYSSADLPFYQEVLQVKFPIRDGTGRIVAIGGITQDVSEHRRAERALRESEAKLRAFMDHAPAIIYVKDARGRYLMVNREFERVEGVAEKTVQGLTLQDLPPRSTRSTLAEQDREVLQQGRVSIREISGEIGNEARDLLVVKFPIRDSSDGIIGIGCFAQDISALKHAQEALRESEARMRAFMDHVPVIMHVKDRQGRYQLVNREFERVEGRPLESVAGRTVWDVLPADAAKAITESDRIALDEGRTVTHEYSVPSRNIYRDRLTIKFPIRSSTGEIIGVGAFTQGITDRKEAERALAQSEARRREAQRRAKLAYWYWNRDVDSYEWSPEAASVLGMAEDRLPRCYADYLSLVLEADRAAVVAVDLRTSISPVARATEYRILRPDGSIAWIRELAEPEQDGSGQDVRIVGTLQDITEQKQAAEALRDSEARLRGFLDHAPFAMYLKDTNLRYLLVNREVERFQNLTSMEICGRTPDEIYPPALAERFIAEDRDVLERGEPITFEYSDPTLPSYTDSLTVRFPVRDADGQVVAIGGITQDISERKRAEAALRLSEERLRQAQRQARMAYWRWQLGNEEYTWSPGSGLIMGVPDSALPRTEVEYFAAIHDDDRERMKRLYRDVASGRAELRAEFRIVQSDGKIAWVRKLGEVEHDALGRPIAVAGTIQDITEQHDLQEQLQQSQKIEAIGQLTGGIAHDFNNLLAIVLGNLELLQEEMLDDDGPAQRIATAVRATLRGADLTKRLLAFARRQTLAPKLTQVNDLIRGMKELLRRPLGPTIDMELRLAQDLEPAEIDPAQLETSLLNLIVNARDAMPEGGRLTIRTANAELPADGSNAGKETRPVDCILISVTDTGNGMSPEVVARAFDPFFTTKGVGQGTGLGLSMVYGFVKQSGGHVQIDSDPGRGTTVSLYLPCAERTAMSDATADADPPDDVRLTA